MTNPIAMVLGFLIVAAIAADMLVYGDEHMIFLGKKMFAFIDWIAFWR